MRKGFIGSRGSQLSSRLSPARGAGGRLYKTAAAISLLGIAFSLCFSQAGSRESSASTPVAAPAAASDVLTPEAQLRQLLIKLKTTARLMHTTAHPDDEDGGMLTCESRGKGADVLLLTLVRGEGGQNKMGSNLLDGLGVLRTLELLAADKYYGVEQRFTRVADFGFSKSPEETFEKWHGHDIALGDMVRVIRTFRPDVLVSRFQGTSKDGHGHHTAAGILTREAFRTAADPARFPDQIREGLAPWQPKKLYVDNVRPPDEYTLSLDTAEVDPLLGMSYVAYAMQGLKHQLSQGAGSWNVNPGPHLTYYKLVDSVLPVPKSGEHEKDFLDGIDTTLPGLAKRLGPEESKVPYLRPVLLLTEGDIQQATAAVEHGNAEAAGAHLLAGLTSVNGVIPKILKSLLSRSAKATLLADLNTKKDQLQEAANLALGVELEATANWNAPPAPTPDDVFVAVPGQSFILSVKLESKAISLLHGGAMNAATPLTNVTVSPDLPPGWHSSMLKRSGPEDSRIVEFEISVPSDAEITRPYWHRDNPETDAIYILDQPRYATLPFTPPPVQVHVTYEVGRAHGSVDSVAQTTYLDTGKLVRSMPLAVGPAISVAIWPVNQVIPLENRRADEVHATVRENLPCALRQSLSVEFAIQPPRGWEGPDSGTVFDPALISSMPGHDAVCSPDFPGVRLSIKETLTAPSRGLSPGRVEAEAVVTYSGKKSSEGYTVITRPDLGAAFYYQPATQNISVVDVKVPAGLHVGYVLGAGDDISDVLRQTGMNVEMISESDLAEGDLSRSGTIVAGIRAYDTREDVKKNNARLLEFVKQGGTLVVLYNSGVSDFNGGHFTPYPAELGRDRVTVEEAPVEILAPENPVFHFPNEITAADFDGWVQERGLYFMHSWDPQFVPLLSSHDPGEAPLTGGLLMTHYGKGIYIYTGYSFFRQLPAGVPGAIRLFVNLVSAGHEPAKRP